MVQLATEKQNFLAFGDLAYSNKTSGMSKVPVYFPPADAYTEGQEIVLSTSELDANFSDFLYEKYNEGKKFRLLHVSYTDDVGKGFSFHGKVRKWTSDHIVITLHRPVKLQRVIESLFKKG